MISYAYRDRPKPVMFNALFNCLLNSKMKIMIRMLTVLIFFIYFLHCLLYYHHL